MAPVIDNSTCFSYIFFFQDKTSLVFFLLMITSVLFSSTANGFLFYLTVRYRQLLWQPQYILLKNISASAIGLAFVITFIVLFSVIYAPSQIHRWWCIAQFSLIRCFFLTYQLTLAAMAIERYIFICHGIHYLRIVNTRNVYASIGLIWLLSVAASLHGGLMLSKLRYGFPEHIKALLCHAITIKDHVPFSWDDEMLVFGPPSLLTCLCVMVIFYCYSSMYCAALRVTKALKCDNRRANFTVGFYLFIFLLQLVPTIIFIRLTLTMEAKRTSCQTYSFTAMPFIMTIPLCINVIFLIARNPLLKNLVLCQNQRQELTTVVSKMCRQQRDERGEQASSRANVKSEVWEINTPSTPQESEDMDKN